MSVLLLGENELVRLVGTGRETDRARGNHFRGKIYTGRILTLQSPAVLLTHSTLS